jgi:glutathione S-transferase
MQLFVSPGACCLGAHVVARELDLPLEVVVVPLRTPESPIHQVSALGRVPALRLHDGTVLTENTAILPFLADLRPGTMMFASPGTTKRAQIQSWIGYINSEVHAASFRAINRPERYSDDPAAHAAIRQRGRKQLKIALLHVERHLETRRLLVGECFTIADAYFGVFARWTAALGEEFADLAAIHRFRLDYEDRPSVRAALQAERVGAENSPQSARAELNGK